VSSLSSLAWTSCAGVPPPPLDRRSASVADDPYVYPGTRVLRNNLELRDPQELSQAEANIAGLALVVLADEPLLGDYDLSHWQAFHRRIFGALYQWAGDLRTVQIAKPNAFYARPEHIVGYAQGIFAELAREDHLKGLDRAAFLERLTHYHAEMYAVHPFREGNTRSLRAFLRQLAGEADRRIAWEHLDHEQSFAANVRSLNGQNDQLWTLLAAIIDRP
jgi:cell filamentation protein